MKNFIKFLGIASAIFLVIGITGCPTNAGGGVDTPAEDPALILKSLMIFDQNAMSGSIEIENEKTEVKPENVVAKFDYGNEKNKKLTVAVTNGTLNEGENKVTLSVAAVKGSYKGWNKNITVMRKTAGGWIPATNAVTMVAITLPASGKIAGTAPSAGVELPQPENYYKGVFIAGRTVTLSGFEMAESEITYALWKEVYDWATSDEREGNIYRFAHEGLKGKDGIGDAEQPVTSLDWHDAIVWCNAYTEMTIGEAECVYRESNKKTILRNSNAKKKVDAAYFDKTKKGFRLPTEAEWEYAARSNADGTLNPLNFLSGANGDYKNEEACNAVAWYKKNSGNTTQKVKSLKENGQKLYDMSGNVWEWCWDLYGSVKEEEETDPAGALGGTFRVFRGGSWYIDSDECLPGYRFNFDPNYAGIDIGLRVCRYLP